MTDGGVDPVAHRDRLVEELVAFGARLRERDVSVHANAAITGARALAAVGFDDRDAARAALQSVYVSDSDGVTTFREEFPAFWARLRGYDDRYREDEAGRELGELLRRPNAVDAATGDDPVAPDAGAEPDPLDVATRATERRVTSFEGVSGSESDISVSGGSPVGDGDPVSDVDERGERLDDAVERLGRALAVIPGRRRHISGVRGRPHARRALRRSLGTGGVVFEVPRRPKRVSDVRATLLIDVSQSVLDTLDRTFLLRFLQVANHSWRRPRTFLFDTDCREVTEALATRTDASAASVLGGAEATWGGGTRIGEALRTVRERHPDSVDRRTVVVVVSDGLETGDLADLESGMAWLADRSAGVLWLNPLAAGDGYEPTARGMRAALPYVDALFGFAGPRDLDVVADELAHYGLDGPVGHAYGSASGDAGGSSP